MVRGGAEAATAHSLLFAFSGGFWRAVGAGRVVDSSNQLARGRRAVEFEKSDERCVMGDAR